MSVLTISKDNFEDEVAKSDKPVLLDFGQHGVDLCKMVSPILDEIAGEVVGAKVGKINIDEQPELAQAFSVMSIPTLVVVKDGKVVQSVVGAKSKATIMQMLDVYGEEKVTS